MDEDPNDSIQNNDAQGGASQNRGGRGRNPVRKVDDFSKKVNKASDLAGKGSKITENLSGKFTAKPSEFMKKSSQALEKVLKEGKKTAKVAATMGSIIATIAAIVIFLFIIIGLIVFIFTGPGLLWAGLKGIISGIGNALWTTMVTHFKGEEYIVESEKIENISEYLDQMGYDLYGYGFITEPVNQVFITDTAEEGTSTDSSLSDITTRKYSLNKDKYTSWITDDYINVNDKDVMRDLKYLVRYIITDNYAYILKNTNFHIFGERFRKSVWFIESC